MLTNFIETMLPSQCMTCDEYIQNNFFCEFCYESICFYDNKEDHRFSLFHYQGTIQDAMVKAKFSNNPTCAQILTKLMLQYLPQQSHNIFSTNYSAITYIPSHFFRRIKRRFDFPLFLAYGLSKYLKIPLLNLLLCIRNEQSLSLQRNKSLRKKSIEGKFCLQKKVKPLSNILLVDDIYTTGITAQEAKKVLSSICEDVSVFTLASK